MLEREKACGFFSQFFFSKINSDKLLRILLHNLAQIFIMFMTGVINFYMLKRQNIFLIFLFTQLIRYSFNLKCIDAQEKRIV